MTKRRRNPHRRLTAFGALEHLRALDRRFGFNAEDIPFCVKRVCEALEDHIEHELARKR